MVYSEPKNHQQSIMLGIGFFLVTPTPAKASSLISPSSKWFFKLPYLCLLIYSSSLLYVIRYCGVQRFTCVNDSIRTIFARFIHSLQQKASRNNLDCSCECLACNKTAGIFTYSNSIRCLIWKLEYFISQKCQSNPYLAKLFR